MTSSETSPTARALLALECLHASPGITADRLAGRLGVSQRAARRYVGILREAGIPVESVRGPYGGYRLGRGLRLPPMVFSATEAMGLVMAVLDGHHSVDDSSDPVGSAIGKIARALPQPLADQIGAVRQAAAAAPDRSAARPDPDITGALVQACSRRHRVRLDYRTEAGSEWLLDVDPWAVVVRHGRWYLLCHSHTADARRAYRVDRVRGVEQLDQEFRPPADLDPVADLEEHLASGWEYDVDVVVEAPVDVVGRYVPRTVGRLEAMGEGRTRLVGSTSSPGRCAEQLAALPAPYLIVGSREVRDAARALALRMLAAVGSEPTDSVPGTPQVRRLTS